ncbi:DUF4468 domain-containing protein [Chryseobacterium sp. BIGb0232]|uniref:DUF4468 domain-containing protein n=1 Tax=Chryseobacterium sp. BIGb0232 TaxID=2940598 RepID=UPI000F46B4A7|nr:DUF4468 domain-containing protein [Chryseobacterium sp. BIGb0232]MCS4302552.1 hypothetical protein [Chryseobacterium sp. BIGb0232]ROS17207.1 hypothetical protein EDF65_1569 [Chryseobacterium nakagawai]
MKRLYAFPILFFSIIVFSQELKFEEVIQTDSSLTKEELFSRARTWAGQNFKSGKNSITTEEKTGAKIKLLIAQLIDVMKKSNETNNDW